MSDLPETFSLCISFTRSGLDGNKRVPWFFVLYPANSKFGVRLRVKDIKEDNTVKPDTEEGDTSSTSPPKHAFLARENAYVDNFSCWGRVIIKSGLSKSERDSCQKIIENKELSEMVNGVRDCQRWVVECLPALGVEFEVTAAMNCCRGQNIWAIEKEINETPDLFFIRGPAYKTRNAKEMEA